MTTMIKIILTLVLLALMAVAFLALAGCSSLKYMSLPASGQNAWPQSVKCVECNFQAYFIGKQRLSDFGKLMRNYECPWNHANWVSR